LRRVLYMHTCRERERETERERERGTERRGGGGGGGGREREICAVHGHGLQGDTCSYSTKRERRWEGGGPFEAMLPPVEESALDALKLGPGLKHKLSLSLSLSLCLSRSLARSLSLSLHDAPLH
jgi:hypothetical protein